MQNTTHSKTTLIKAALAHIAEEGWTRRAFEKAETPHGWKSGTYAAHFPGGVQDFICAVQEWVDEGMLEKIATNPAFVTSKVREKIFFAVMARLEILKPYRDAMERLAAHQLLPWNKPWAMKNLAHTADAIWRGAGDRSVDYNFYTKRILLSGVYATTLHFWFSDESADYAATQGFLKRRIEDVLKFGKTVNDLKERFMGKAA
jgi:ubiquinone biosynthesis protein COQ9